LALFAGDCSEARDGNLEIVGGTNRALTRGNFKAMRRNENLFHSFQGFPFKLFLYGRGFGLPVALWRNGPAGWKSVFLVKAVRGWLRKMLRW